MENIFITAEEANIEATRRGNWREFENRKRRNNDEKRASLIGRRNEAKGVH